MWNAISQQLSDALGREFKIQQRESITGGDIHRAFKVADHHCSLFVKVNERDKLELFQTEALGLNLLNRSELIVPEVVAMGTTSDQAFLALQYLDLGNATNAQWYQFGQALARLHRDNAQSQYGFDEDNFIGRTPQPNRWQSNWSQFFAEQRIGWQLKLAQDKGHQFGNIDRWIEACAQTLRHHQPQPSLLHGDLWRGNLGFVEGQGALFDPASYYGDRETDLAMTELFSPLPQDFYRGYDAEWPIDKGYAKRKPIYQLYHLLNHLNLFGGSYLQQCQMQMQELFCDAH
ncbi:fructosamine kinase family protein [Ferrimonas marina]|uniref:Fructosamine-3-kinase n=1 Tax=Ferrimonas marina TaxID=299255 RepID=A0A1M5NJP4_9GAMM|nr:fructosamine kinase family protein [Ferrimonas marina]SHG89738.1 Fructosamine-3-kinase [Ferrimonas marina]